MDVIGGSPFAVDLISLSASALIVQSRIVEPTPHVSHSKSGAHGVTPTTEDSPPLQVTMVCMDLLKPYWHRASSMAANNRSSRRAGRKKDLVCW